MLHGTVFSWIAHEEIFPFYLISLEGETSLEIWTWKDLNNREPSDFERSDRMSDQKLDQKLDKKLSQNSDQISGPTIRCEIRWLIGCWICCQFWATMNQWVSERMSARYASKSKDLSHFLWYFKKKTDFSMKSSIFLWYSF